MTADAIKSTNAERVLAYATDARPAWLFAQDGAPIWRNLAAAYFLAKPKKHSIKLAPPAKPIKGQIARVLRLGAEGRASLSRIQFMAGDKPASATCSCTPLTWEEGQQALLIVGVDAVARELIDSGAADLTPDETLWRRGALGTADDGREEEPPIAQGEPADAAELAQNEDTPAIEAASVAEPPPPVETVAIEAGDAPQQVPTSSGPDDELPESVHRLSDLMNRLMAHERLFSPLTEEDDDARDVVDGAVLEPGEAGQETENGAEPADAGAAAVAVPGDEPSPAGLFRVIGRYLRRTEEEDAGATAPLPAEETEAEMDMAELARLDEGAEDEPMPVAAVEVAEAPAKPQAEDPPEDGEDGTGDEAAIIADTLRDAEAVDRVSRYNFDELSRILNDRVGEMAAPAPPEAERLASAPPGSILAHQRASTGAGSLINLGGETLVLNRLPLGILVFRDQQVLFANRAITEMTGYDSVESLRGAGLAAIFPGAEGQDAGPVNHLVQRNGTLVPVTARLQSISWQGRPALMLSASATEVRTGHEGAVRAFAGAFANARGDGFFETNRAGVVSAVNAKAAAELGEGPDTLVGRKLADLVSQPDLADLREFLERPARFAETARPVIRVKAAAPDVELLIFAQGQAGIVSGYFGFVHRMEAPMQPRIAGPAEPDAGLLARLSRGVRRPLNTIIGFSDLIRSAAFGAIENQRYIDYAQDIKTAGEEISALVDELDDYARLQDGRYLPQRASIDLMGLLESCVRRIRSQAGMRRVIVRNAISENLPRVTADRASLAQAVLNLLASAIDQTPVGGAVVISAQETDEGGIAIHVRDSSDNGTDLSERFVVFRDGVGRDGQALTPVRSSVGLALTRSLLAVNAFSLSVDPAGQQGMLFSMVIPADLVEKR